MAGEITDPRRAEPGRALGERETLEGWLEYHRTTLLLKCEGLTDAQRKATPVPSSALSLHGLVRHMAEVERTWFVRGLLGRIAEPFIWHQPGQRDDELQPLTSARWETDLAAWQQACATSRDAAAGLGLDSAASFDGQPLTLRWVLSHMIEEYARHNGHADLLRELADGAVGR